jgi:hypothetical protein
LAVFVKLEKRALHRICGGTNNTLPLLVEACLGTCGSVDDAGLGVDRGGSASLKLDIKEFVELGLAVKLGSNRIHHLDGFGARIHIVSIEFTKQVREVFSSVRDSVVASRVSIDEHIGHGVRRSSGVVVGMTCP